MMTLWMLAATAAWAQMPPAHPTNPGMDWQIPAAVLVAGLLIGFLVVSKLQSSDDSVEEASRRLDLQSAKDEVVEALQALEVEKSKMDPAEYEAERQALLGRGARAMAVLAGDDVAPDEATPEGPSEAETAATAAAAAPRRGAPDPTPEPAPVAAASPEPAGGLAPEWKGALYALVAVGVIGGLGWTLQKMAQPRVGEMGMTGGEIVNNNNAVSQTDPKDNPSFKASVEMLEARLRVDENDVDALNGLTQLYFTHGDPSTAMEFNKKALELAPKDNDARTFRAVLSAMMSMTDRAVQLLDEVLAESPDDPKATTYKGLILMELQQFDQAVVLLERANELQPGNEVLGRALADARTLAAGGTPTAVGSGDAIVSGTIRLDPSLSVRGTETIFVSVSDPSKPGPPVAADKLPAGPFPLSFDLTTADIRAMPGAGGVPAVMDLKIRVDMDGNAMTKEPGPKAHLTGVTKGTAGLDVVLTLDGSATAAPGGAPTPPPAPAATGQTLVSGTATLGPGAAMQPGQTVFISVRNPAGGPPVAADRVDGASFPLQFTITDAHVLSMGGSPPPIPDQLIVSVRLDNDGNAMTKDGEPAATASDIAKGTTGMALTLQ